jgi:integrase
METLKIPKHYVTKGLYVYCNRCKRIITDKKGQFIVSCRHYNDQVYKSVVYPPGSRKAKTKVYQTRDIEAVRDLHIEFEKTVKKGLPVIIEEKDVPRAKPQSIKECIGLYFEYIIGPSSESELTANQKQVIKYVLYFGKFLRSKEVNIDTIGISDIEPKYIKLFRSYLEERYSSTTVNRYLTFLKGLFNYLINKEGYQIMNPFYGEKHKPTNHISKSFPINDLETFLDRITPEEGKKVYTQKVRKNLYKNYLKEIFLLALLTGRRREGLVTMKFNEITADKNGRPYYITTNDIKFNKRYRLFHENDKKKVIIPVSVEMEEFLNLMGYEKYKGTDRYIVASDIRENRTTIMNLTSKAFSHYWTKYSTEKELEFNSLRKTYINEIDIRYGSRGKIITHGATGELINKHYRDVMKIIDDMRGQYLYKELEKSYSTILLQIKKPLT